MRLIPAQKKYNKVRFVDFTVKPSDYNFKRFHNSMILILLAERVWRKKREYPC